MMRVLMPSITVIDRFGDLNQLDLRQTDFAPFCEG
jgi:hypothetical protein